MGHFGRMDSLVEENARLRAFSIQALTQIWVPHPRRVFVFAARVGDRRCPDRMRLGRKGSRQRVANLEASKERMERRVHELLRALKEAQRAAITMIASCFFRVPGASAQVSPLRPGIQTTPRRLPYRLKIT